MSGKNIFIAKSADVLGDVRIGDHTSIWYQAVLRGDMESITIGERSNVQDCAVVHVDTNCPVKIGNGVTIGHGAIVHGCTIGNNVLIGMGAIILNGAVIGDNCIIGAGALITQNKVIPEGSMVYGNPGKVVRKVTDQEIDGIIDNAREYMKCMKDEKGKMYYEAENGVIIVKDL